MLYYWHFAKNFASIVKPLRHLREKWFHMDGCCKDMEASIEVLAVILQAETDGDHVAVLHPWHDS